MTIAHVAWVVMFIAWLIQFVAWKNASKQVDFWSGKYFKLRSEKRALHHELLQLRWESTRRDHPAIRGKDGWWKDV